MNNTILIMGITAIALSVIPIAWLIGVRKKYGSNASFKSLIIGALGFVISALVLEQLVHSVVLMGNNPIGNFLRTNVVAYCLYGILAAGIFEEVGRYIFMKVFMKKSLTKENALMYGVGHGGIEVYLITVMSIVNYIVIAMTIQGLNPSDAMQALQIPVGQEAVFESLVVNINGFNLFYAAVSFLERFICVPAHIVMTLIVFKSIQSKEKKFLFMAIVFHAIFDLGAVLYQIGVMPLVGSEVWCLMMLIVMYFYQKKYC